MKFFLDDNDNLLGMADIFNVLLFIGYGISFLLVIMMMYGFYWLINKII